jgi:pyruvate formate lyase activating enzyme
VAKQEAQLWRQADGQNVQCELCGHRCKIAAGQYGLCRVRQNVAGALQTLNYGSLVALNVDPIEKKPLFHVLPGSTSLSIAAAGCNFQCEFCQNWQISQQPRDGGGILGQATSPEQVVSAAGNYDCASISYTYTEPTVFFEFARDCSRLAHEQGIKNCFVSNGFLTEKAVGELTGLLDAINVDLKAFRDKTYREIMKASLDPVLTCLRSLVAAGIWVEVTTLVVPDMNDSREELSDIAHFIADELGPDVPWHVSRFRGEYQMRDHGATPRETLEMATALGTEAGLKHVYCGNLHGQVDENTYCPSCKERLIDRTGFHVRQNRLQDGACPDCGQALAGLWS